MDLDYKMKAMWEEMHAVQRRVSLISKELTQISQKILSTDISAENAKDIIEDIIDHEQLVSLVRLEVLGLHDEVHGLQRDRMLNTQQYEDSKFFLEEADCTLTQLEFLFERINFLMGAVMDFINIKQNKIIQVFSVASVALLPPTLVASVYGMNLKFPEILALGDLAYPYTVSVMLLSAILPMFIFWRKGWLK